jgi:hypothetical protein
MAKKKNIIRYIFAILVFLVAFPLSAPFVIAKADDLLIQDNGEIILLVTDNKVLGSSTTSNVTAKTSPPNQNKSSSSPSPQQPPLSAPSKIIPLVPAHTQSTVTINPSEAKDKKVSVTITTTTPQQNPSPTTSSTSPSSKSPTSGSTSPGSKNPITQTGQNPQQPGQNAIPKTNVINKVVNQVVAEGSSGQPILAIKSGQNNQVTIQQGKTEVSTQLPIQIDTKTHAVSVTTQTGATKISVLPSEAVKGVSDKGLISTGSNTASPKVTLIQDNGQVAYKLEGERVGKLLGIFEIRSPTEVKISAQTGKILQTTQSPAFNIFGFFIR